MVYDSLNQISATKAAAAIRNGKFSSFDLVKSCVDRIKSREPTVHAWVEFDPDRALKEAEYADKKLQSGKESGVLHGVPVGLKDIIDTLDMPTQMGSALFSNRRPAQDAMCTNLLRQAGAVILGKTVTTEFALTGAKKTANPHNILHTPGGSSSGSAAAVADFMVPLAVGSQTGGSMIRPASYCGVYGYKPTFGLISRRGVFILARVLDHLGVYARSVEDLMLISGCLMVYDSRDLDMKKDFDYIGLASNNVNIAKKSPRIAFIKGPAWEYTESYMVTIFESYLSRLETKVEEVTLSGIFDGALEAHRVIMESNLWHNLGVYRERKEKLLMPETVRRIDSGKHITASDYIEASELVCSLQTALESLFERYDAIITPSATGEAPRGLTNTGNAVMQKIWTLTGLPTISLPHMLGPNGLPIGVQVIGPRGADNKLFRIAFWLDNLIRTQDGGIKN